jgi:hypothetical protein
MQVKDTSKKKNLEKYTKKMAILQYLERSPGCFVTTKCKNEWQD